MNVLWQGCRDRYLFFRGGKMAGMAERSLVPWQRSGRLCLDTDTLLDLWHWWVVLYDDTDGVWMPTGRYCRRCDAKRAMECYAAGTPLRLDPQAHGRRGRRGKAAWDALFAQMEAAKVGFDRRMAAVLMRAAAQRAVNEVATRFPGTPMPVVLVGGV